jgi:hypothetical protein
MHPLPRPLSSAAPRWLSALLLSGMLAACGGGGGGDPVGNSNPSGSGGSGGSSSGGSSSGGSSSGGSSSGSGSTGTVVVRALGTMPAEPTVTPAPATCAPISGGRDFQVGSGNASTDGNTYSEVQQVPWETLRAGDTVRIFYRSTPYKAKFAVFATGTAALPVRICGVKGGAGERPVIDGNGAVTRTAAAYLSALANTPADRGTLEDLAVVMLTYDRGDYYSFPAYVQIDGLNIVRGHQSYTFTDTTGATRTYSTSSACLSVRRGQHITLVDNEVSDCGQALYTVSLDDYIGDDPANTQYTVTKDIRVARNYFWNNGIAGSDREHTSYTASQNIVIELNHYGPPRSGALGNSVKDRSAGTVVRYNFIEEGAHSIDLVDAQDFPLTATAANSGYEYSFVYGNLIRKDGDTGSFFHYGGDQLGSEPGANWGEPWFRQGVLYFFDNTVYGTGSSAEIFQVSTTLERVEAWNNIFAFASTVANPNMRTDQDVNTAYWTAAGIVNLGVNWINAGWSDYDIYHPLTGQLLGSANLLTGTTVPINTSTFAPLTGSSVLGAGGSGPSMGTPHVARLQIAPASGFLAAPTTRSSVLDLGGIEVP